MVSGSVAMVNFLKLSQIELGSSCSVKTFVLPTTLKNN